VGCRTRHTRWALHQAFSRPRTAAKPMKKRGHNNLVQINIDGPFGADMSILLNLIID
jgi:hypothetical protein